jgi:hypothetical protein
MIEALRRLVGEWTTEMTHPNFDGVVHGTVTVEWLEGERFLIHRARTDHPDFPDAISIVGDMEHDRVGDQAESSLSMHYYDSRGVFRVYRVSVDDRTWKIWRDDPTFAQRFIGTFDGDAIAGVWQLSRDNETWADDLKINYLRVGTSGRTAARRDT